MFVFKNREAFPLTRNEKIVREILRFLLLIIACVIVKGMLNQNQNVNEDDLLVPICATAIQIFLVLYIFNAFTTGNLVRRWANDSIRIAVFNFIKENLKTDDAKATKFTTYFFGVFGFINLIAITWWEFN